VKTFLSRSFPFFGTLPFSKDLGSFLKTCIAAVGKAEFPVSQYNLLEVEKRSDTMGTFSFTSSQATMNMEGPIGTLPLSESLGNRYYALSTHRHLIAGMAQDHCVGRDLLIIGDAGSGKSVLAHEFARLTGYETTLFSLVSYVSTVYALANPFSVQGYECSRFAATSKCE